MSRQHVSSSNLRSVGYDSQRQILEIEFHSGGVYQYYHVPSNVYAELMNAGSLGQYFSAFIKERFRYSRIC
jgi:hypothetical protein